MSSSHEYLTAEHALAYLAKSDKIPHRTEGEGVLLELLPATTKRVLDIGCGDGRLMALVKLAHSGATGIALDFSPVMLDAARRRFANEPAIKVVEHDLALPLPGLGRFDTIVSCFAIHHLDDARSSTGKSSRCLSRAEFSAIWNTLLLPPKICTRPFTRP